MTGSAFRVAVTGDYEELALEVAPWERLGPEVAVLPFNRPLGSAEATVAALRNFDAIALMRERTSLSGPVLSQLPRLKLIVFTGRNVTTIDYATAARLGIAVCGTVGAGANPSRGGGSPSELALALMLACAWNIPRADSLVRAGNWAFGPGNLLRGKALGILGYGNIGKAVARYGLALGMSVLAFSRSLSDEEALANGVRKVDLATLLREADVVTIHLPLTSATRGLIGAREIGWMKPGVILINTARAGIVDPLAMREALRTLKIAMAGLDVFDQEPPPADDPLLTLPNVVLTPHIGYVTRENLAGMYGKVVEVVAAFRRGTLLNPHAPSV